MRLLRAWLDTWAGLGAIITGLRRLDLGGDAVGGGAAGGVGDGTRVGGLPVSLSERRARLTRLYEEIWRWGQSRYDSDVAKRRIEAVDARSQLFIVGEAYAQKQVRLTGINWFNAQGSVGLAGQKLETLLGCVGYTLYPPTRITLAHCSIENKKLNLKTAYTTDIFPCYPPHGVAPDPVMLADAIERRFLLRELEILRPRVMLLLGDHSYHTFHNYVLRRTTRCISDEFCDLSPTSPVIEYGGARVLPFYHPSPANVQFSQWFERFRMRLCEQPQVQAIKAALEG